MKINISFLNSYIETQILACVSFASYRVLKINAKFDIHETVVKNIILELYITKFVDESMIISIVSILLYSLIVRADCV